MYENHGAVFCEGFLNALLSEHLSDRRNLSVLTQSEKQRRRRELSYIWLQSCTTSANSLNFQVGFAFFQALNTTGAISQ